MTQLIEQPKDFEVKGDGVIVLPAPKDLEKVEISETPTVEIKGNTYSLHYMEDIAAEKKWFLPCLAKKKAIEYNSMFGKAEPREISNMLMKDPEFLHVIQFALSYKMADGSVLVWIEEINSWGFVYAQAIPEKYHIQPSKINEINK